MFSYIANMSTVPLSADASRVEAVAAEDEKGVLFSEEELAIAERNANQVVTTSPPSLGYFSIALIIVNRMVGTLKAKMATNAR